MRHELTKSALHMLSNVGLSTWLISNSLTAYLTGRDLNSSAGRVTNIIASTTVRKYSNIN